MGYYIQGDDCISVSTSMALCKVRVYGELTNSLLRRTRNFGRSYATAAPLTVLSERTDEHARAFRLYTKSHIPTLFEHYAPSLDSKSYLAAAQVFPMRANNYVLEDLIDWLVFKSLYSSSQLWQSELVDIWKGHSVPHLTNRST